MTTDFTYGDKTITAAGGFKPAILDAPLDARTRVETKADIESIPNPFVGMHIIVKADESNGNAMTEYVVKSLKANALGIVNSVVDEVELYRDFLNIPQPNYSFNINMIAANSAPSVVTSGTYPNLVFTFNIPQGTGGTGEVVYGNIIAPTSITFVAGSSTTFDIKLDQAPTSDQVVVVTPTKCTIDKTSLVFTASNYNIPQTISVTARNASNTKIVLSSPNVPDVEIAVAVTNEPVETTTYTVTNNLTNCTTNNSAISVDQGALYSATISPNSGYDMSSITVTMGGTDITSSAVSGNVITVNNVTGNIVVTANATQQSTQPATYTITRNLTNCSSSNTSNSIAEGNSYSTTISANSGYNMGSIAVTMGGTNITSSAVSGNTVTISNVTGNIVITASATQQSSSENVIYDETGKTLTINNATYDSGTSTITIPDNSMTYNENNKTIII